MSLSSEAWVTGFFTAKAILTVRFDLLLLLSAGKRNLVEEGESTAVGNVIDLYKQGGGDWK